MLTQHQLFALIRAMEEQGASRATVQSTLTYAQTLLLEHLASSSVWKAMDKLDKQRSS